jgi:integrase
MQSELKKEPKVMNKTMTAAELAAAMREAGVSMKALAAAFNKSDGNATTKLIANQAQADKAEPGVHRVKGAPGVYLKKGLNGAGSWFRRYWRDGKRREMGLGAFKDVSLAELRDKALDFDMQRKTGDPIELNRAAKAAAKAVAQAAAQTAERWDFITATEAYLKAHAPTWKHPRARSLWVNPVIKYANPVIGKLQLDDIKVEHIEAIMDECIASGAPDAALRIRLRIEQVLNAATAKGKRDAKLPNPASGKLIKAIRPTKRQGAAEHFRRIALDDAPAAFQKLIELAQESTSLAALAFMILTAARPSEALNAQWSEIDLTKRLWTVPAQRMKGGKEHVVPLSETAVAILARQASVRVGDGAAVFPGRSDSPVSYATFSAAARDIGFDVGSPHSWRSIFRDACGDRLRVDRDLAEACLAHSLGSVEAAYRRETAIEARRPVMDAYARWLLDEGANVVAFKARA